MKSPKVLVIGGIVVFVALAAAYLLVSNLRGGSPSQLQEPLTMPTPIVTPAGQENAQLTPTAPTGATTGVQNIVSNTGAWCMNHNDAAAYPNGARFFSKYAEESLICRTLQGGFEREDGSIILTKIITSTPAIGYEPWDGITYAP